MNFHGVQVVCPHCRGELENSRVEGGEGFRCRACDKQYPIVAGVPDLRVFPDPYIDIAADREKGLKVAAKLDEMSFAELVEFYYGMTSVVPAHHAKLYSRGVLAAGPRSEAALDSWRSAAGEGGGKAPGSVFLDIGCGTGPLLAAAAKRYERVVGVDVAFRWLVVGKKRLMEQGVDAVLICACAEALPFPDGLFDAAAMESSVEHVQDQVAAVGQCRRVLKPGGVVFVSTPNRFSVGPDPQTGVWAGSWLPKGIVAWIVRRQGGIPPKRKLLSAGGVRGLLLGGGFADVRVTVPDIAEGQRSHFSGLMRVAIDGYRLARRLPISRQLLRVIGPLLHAVGRKP